VQREQVQRVIADEAAKLEGTPHLAQAIDLLERTALSDEPEEFLTLPAYELLEAVEA
jgi:hypothetical protein